MPKQKESAPEYRWRGTQREFVSLAEGEMIEGVYVKRDATQYGPVYKIRTGDGIKMLSGNRAQLDSLFDDIESDPDFAGGPFGHYIAVRRLENTKSSSGRRVAQYELAHVYEKCPKGCTPF